MIQALLGHNQVAFIDLALQKSELMTEVLLGHNLVVFVERWSPYRDQN